MKLSAATKASQDHDKTTDHKLIAADHDRVFIGAETLDQDGGHSIGQCREQNKAFSSQCHSALKTAAGQIDQDNTCKPNDAAKDFGNGKLFLMEDDIGNYDCLSEIFAKSPSEQLLLRILHPGSIILWELCKLKNNRKEKYVLHFP